MLATYAHGSLSASTKIRTVLLVLSAMLVLRLWWLLSFLVATGTFFGLRWQHVVLLVVATMTVTLTVTMAVSVIKAVIAATVSAAASLT